MNSNSPMKESVYGYARFTGAFSPGFRVPRMSNIICMKLKPHKGMTAWLLWPAIYIIGVLLKVGPIQRKCILASP